MSTATATTDPAPSPVSSVPPIEDSTTGLQLALSVPLWFENPEFAAWVERRTGKGLATWHTAGTPMCDFSDVFVCVDPGLSGEGSDDPTAFEDGHQARLDCMPERFWLAVVNACRSAFPCIPDGSLHIVVRLLPC